jgi:hypothetical protein
MRRHCARSGFRTQLTSPYVVEGEQDGFSNGIVCARVQVVREVAAQAILGSTSNSTGFVAV